MTPSWYDLLGVEPGASAEEIRRSWKTSIADLDPGDRRFRLCNTAAEVLLDPDRRAAYDAELAEEAEPAPVAEEPRPEDLDAADSDYSHDSAADSADDTDDIADDSRSSADTVAAAAVPVGRKKGSASDADATVERPVVSKTTSTGASTGGSSTSAGTSRKLALVTAVLAVLAVGLVIATVLVAVRGGEASASGGSDDALPDDKQVAAARAAAEEAVVPVLSYDFRTLDRDQTEARSYLTADYAKQYDRFFESAVLVNAPSTRTVVRVQVLDSATVRTGPDRVDVLLFVNRPTVNKKVTEPVVYHDQVTMRMVEQDGTWLVGCMITEPGTPCPT